MTWFRDRRPSTLIALAVLTPLLLGLIVFFWQARAAQSSLEVAGIDAVRLQDRLVAGDADGAKLRLQQLQGSTEDARSSVDGVLWRIGSTLPGVGKDIQAIRTIAEELDRVADQALPPIVGASADISANTFSPRDGRVRLDAIESVAPALNEASQVFEQSRRAVSQIDIGSLNVMQGPIEDAKSKLESAASAGVSADLAARLLPGLLGADSPREYLLMNQNNAEIRPTGGIVGSFALIKVNKGRLTLTNNGSIQDLLPLDSSPLPLTKDELSVFPSTLGSDLRDVNITPDFPRTAAFAKSLVKERLGISVDGVLSVDPVALSYLIAGTGPITLDNGFVLTEENAVSTLLNKVYLTFGDPDDQDDFFANATDSIFDAFTDGVGDPTAVLRGLVRGIEENRISFWSADKGEQKLIGTTDLSGAFVADDGDVPHVGVYLSDAASTKMEYYLDFVTVPVAVNCLDGDRQVISMTTTLTSTAPDGLPDAVTGYGDFVAKGKMRLNVRLFAPAGGDFTSVRLNGKSLTIQSGQLQGRRITNVSVLLAEGETATITANVTSGRGQSGRPVFTTTPGITPSRNDFEIQSACR